MVTWCYAHYISVFLPIVPDRGKKKKTRNFDVDKAVLLLFLLIILKGEDTHCWTSFATLYDYNNVKELCTYLGKVKVVL